MITDTAPAGNVPEFDLGDRMKKALKYGSVSVKDMALYLDVDPATVSRWMGGKKHPSVQTLRLWALRTGVVYDWLKDGQVGYSGPGGSVTRRYQTPRYPRTGDATVTPIRDTFGTTAASQGQDQDQTAAAA